MTGQLVDEVRGIRRLLTEASRELETPTADSMSACADRLHEAISLLADVERLALRAPESDRLVLREEVHALRRELHLIGRLLAQAAQLQIGWAQLLGAIPASYNATGKVDDPVRPSLEIKA